jgi:MoaA/NifB/PqqE/SkfB family radical SAM enzyme/SAM-dependent methyltransferase
MAFDPVHWTRLEYSGVPIYVRPDRPDWIVPNRSGDRVLRELIENGQVSRDPLTWRFLRRLPDGDSRAYPGRHALLKTDRLRELWFHVTNNCNVTCTHCLVSSAPGARGEIAAARILEVAGQAQKLGCTVFALSGGEPFVHKEFEAIVDGLLAFEDAQVAVLTNGLLLDKRKAALDRWPSDRFHLQISVDGTRETHDGVRGERTFERLEPQLKRLSASGVPFTLSMCVMDENRAVMPEFVDYAASVGASNVHFLWYFVRGRGDEAAYTDPTEIFGYLKQAAAKAAASGIEIDNIEACRTQVFSPSGTLRDGGNSGWESLAMGPDDKLYPSPALMGMPDLGTPVDGDLSRAWRESPVLEGLRRATATGMSSPLRFIVGGGDQDHSFVHGGRFIGDDPYLPLYEQTALWLIATEASKQTEDGPPGLRLKMGDLLARCGDTGEVALVHSNCLLAVASKDHVRIVSEFYAEASKSPNEEIKNPVCYPEEWTEHVHPDCMVRSYGCGSPVLDAEIGPGETIVDLGSGTGVECLIASKMVGPEGSVIGIDMLDPMIELARRGARTAADRLGYANVEFKKAFLESLPLDDATVDVVLSNCVLNLSHHKRRTFGEIFRVLVDGGRLVASDVVCETEPSSSIRNDDTLQGECIAGALTQRDLVGLLEESGFASIRILKRFPYRVVRGHPFFSVTFAAEKSVRTVEKRIMYRGPFAAVVTREGELIPAGQTCSVNVAEHLDDPEQVLEFDSEGNATHAEVGGSACCSVAPVSEESKPRESAGCCGSKSEAACASAESSESRHSRGCMTCGAPLAYSTEDREVTCQYCDGRFVSSVVCEEAHFVCDACHTANALEVIEKVCLSTDETAMIPLLRRIRRHEAVPLHGPEHHALVPGIILATYRNRGGDISDEKIRSAIRRGTQVPGGACGFMGACGAAVGVGIAFGAVLDSTPLDPEGRRAALATTGEVLAELAKLEAARCCQRECYVALTKAVELSERMLPIKLEAGPPFECEQADLIEECIGPECPLFAV